MNNCQYCDKILSCKRAHLRHENSCKEKETFLLKKEIERQQELNKKIQTKYEELQTKYDKIFEEKVILEKKVEVLEKTVQLKTEFAEEKVALLKEFIPKSKKSNHSQTNNDEEDEEDQKAPMNQFNGKNIYVTQNQIYLDKVNNLTPINDIINNIIQNGDLLYYLSKSVEHFTNYINTELAKGVVVKNFKKLLVCYRFKNENNEIINLVDNLETIIICMYFDKNFIDRVEEIYDIYDRESNNAGEQFDIEKHNNITTFSQFLKSYYNSTEEDIKKALKDSNGNKKILEGLFKNSIEKILKKANKLRQ